MSPLDARLRVKGVTGLRVADASVMPEHVTVNPNITCFMIGEKAAQLILADRAWPPRRCGGPPVGARRICVRRTGRGPVTPAACAAPSAGDHSPEASAVSPSTVSAATGAAPPWVTEILRGLACSATGMVRVRTPSL